MTFLNFDPRKQLIKRQTNSTILTVQCTNLIYTTFIQELIYTTFIQELSLLKSKIDCQKSVQQFQFTAPAQIWQL